MASSSITFEINKRSGRLVMIDEPEQEGVNDGKKVPKPV